MVKISVVIPVYNVENYLKECLDSIINQTLEDIEIICINDGSTDNTLNILNKIANKDNRVKVFHQENKGCGAARNYALTKATGKYLYFMDSDDILKENALQEFYNIAEEKNLDFLIFQAINYTDETKEYYTTDLYCMNEIADMVGEEVFNYKDLGEKIFKISVPAWSKFYNREFVNKSGAQFPEGLIFEDNVFFWHILFSAERIGFLKKQLYIRRRYNSSITASYDERFIDIIKINNLIIQKFIEFNQFNQFKNELYNKKIKSITSRLSQIDDEFKELYYKEMKKDFSKIRTNEKYDEFLICLNRLNKESYKSVIFSENYKEFAKNKEAEELIRKYKTGRIDIQNLTEESNTIEVLNSNYESKIVFAEWFENNNGNILVVEGIDGKLDLKIRCKTSGILKIELKGPYLTDKNNNAFPVYIDYKSLLINNIEQLEENQLVNYEEKYIFKKDVNPNEIVEIYVEWSPFNKSSIFKNIRFNNLKEENKNLQAKNKTLEEENKNLKRKQEELINSRSWKITSPLKIGKK